MREIKFRAWWIKEKTMLHNVQNFYDTLGDKTHGNEYEPESCFGGLLDNDKYEVMQYTGLKDENGKEIYEGDILEWHSAAVHKGQNTMKRQVVIWNGRTASFEGCSGGVVIGNIYENPELIKETK